MEDLQMGSTSAEVGNLQRVLCRQDYRDWAGLPIADDESFGQRTDYALSQWQTRSGLVRTGVFGKRDRELARKQGFIPFVQAKNVTLIHPRTRRLDVIVIHTMENAEKPGSADAVASWFGGLNPSYKAPPASAHYCVDSDSTVQCVRDMDVAWHAPGLNNNGLGIEHNGFARQTPEEWSDGASEATLQRSAKLVMALSVRYDIPIVRLTPEMLLAGERGICGHNDATVAFPGPGRTHSDPGPSFPWTHYLELIQGASL